MKPIVGIYIQTLGSSRGLLLLIVKLPSSRGFVSSSNSNSEEMRRQQALSPRQDSSGRGPPPPHTSAASSRRGVGPRVDIDIIDIDIVQVKLFIGACPGVHRDKFITQYKKVFHVQSPQMCLPTHIKIVKWIDGFCILLHLVYKTISYCWRLKKHIFHLAFGKRKF